MWWLALLFLFVPVVSAWRDPRKMRIAVYLLVALAAGFIAAFAAILAVDEAVGAYLLLALFFLILFVVVVLGVVLVLNGIALIRREGLRPRNLLSLGLGLVILAYFGVGVVMITLSWVALVPWLVGVGLPVGYLAFGFLAYLLYSALYQSVTRHWGRPVDAVVVLGSGLINGRVPPLLASRLDQGRQVYDRALAAGRQPVLTVSGGQGSDEARPESVAMAEYLVDHGVPPTDILVEDQSRTTQENLAYSKALLASAARTGRVAVVTNNFHAFRAALSMRQAGLPGYAVGAPTAGYFWPNATIREYVAILRDHFVVTLVLFILTALPLVGLIVMALL
jgi:uncharacterized SAM-binding protein YcdF (DUF218 family)